MARIHRSGGFEGPGEAKTAEYLEQHLPRDWDVICNKEIPEPNSSREIDLIVVGRYLVFAIEEKHWWGQVEGNEDAWILSDGESRPSPLNQVKQAAGKLKSFIRTVAFVAPFRRPTKRRPFAPSWLTIRRSRAGACIR